MKRRDFVAFLTSAIAFPRLALAQDRPKLARVGFLGPAPAVNFVPRVDALRAGLRELGYIEGKDLIFEFRWWERPDELSGLAAELVRSGLDVIVAPSSTETAILLAATRTVPVVFSTHGDPVGIGHVASLARPGGNATGSTSVSPSSSRRSWRRLRKRSRRRSNSACSSPPPTHCVSRLSKPPRPPHAASEWRSVAFPVRLEGDFPRRTRQNATGRRRWPDGDFLFLLMISRRAHLAELALPPSTVCRACSGHKDNVLAGGMMSYAPDAHDLNRRAAGLRG